MTSAVTEKFGPYEVLDRLGRGGMGLVYRAWDDRLQREVAIKLLHNECPEPGMHERFLHEARAASALNHPNICTVFDIGDKDGTPYLVMELLQGQTLKARLEKGPIPIEEIVQLGREIADALGAAHLRGIVHRDIKPANIFLVQRPNGGAQAKILDFGLAKMELPDHPLTGDLPLRADHTTSAGSTVGTVAYMSPEQARGESLDGRTDLFSLGVTMYEMATRRLPFPGSTSALAFVQLLNHAPAPIRESNLAVPKALDRIILKLLQKNPINRFQNATELSSALAALLPGNSGKLPTRAAPASRVRIADPSASGSQSTTSSSIRQPVPQADFAALFRPPPSNPPSNPTSSPTRPPSTPAPSKPPSGPPSWLLTHIPEPRSAASRAPVLATPAPRPLVPTPAVAPQPQAVAPTPPPSNSISIAHASQETPQEKTRFSPANQPAAIKQSAPPSPLIPAAAATPPAETTEGNTSPAAAPLISRLRAPSVSLAHIPSPRLPLESPTDPRDPIDPASHLSLGDRDDLALAATGSRPRLRIARILAVASILAVFATAFLFVRNYLLHQPLLGPNDRLMIAAIDNRTGDKTLDGVAASALEIELAQSPLLTLRPVSPSALRQLPTSQTLARQAAQSAGATAYLYGALTSSSAAYVLSIEIRTTAKARTLATASEIAPTRAELPAAIDRAAAKLRSALRVDLKPASSPANVPLARDATANLDALHAYSLGESALLSARPLATRIDDALAAFQSAASLDPNFAQPQLQLTRLYASQHAETAAASAARLAQSAAANASPRTNLLAQYAYQVNATGDLAHATGLIQHFIALYPHDPEGARDLAQVLRLQGQFSAALDAAQHGLDADPNDAGLSREAQLSLIALDRYDDALDLQQKSAHLDSPHDGIALIAAYLARNPTLLATAIERVARPPRSAGSMAAYGLYLDDTGQLSAGETLWRATAAGLSSSSASAGAGPWLLAQGALDRALAADCATALDLAHAAIPTLTSAVSPRASQRMPTLPGPATTFNAGVAAALCGNRPLAQQAIAALTRNWPHASAVTGYYLPDLNAALALGRHNYQAALVALQPAALAPAAQPPTRQTDLISLTPYLRGLAHLGLHQPQLAIADFEGVLAHHGAALTSGSNVYPMAQIALARAFASNGSQPGDKPNSLQAYKNFVTLWPSADPANPLLREATAAIH